MGLGVEGLGVEGGVGCRGVGLGVEGWGWV